MVNSAASKAAFQLFGCFARAVLAVLLLYGFPAIGQTQYTFQALQSLGIENATGISPQRNGLILASDGALYGTTANGGRRGGGTVFRMNADGTGLTVLQSFWYPVAGENGAAPYGRLLEASDGIFYGTTTSGGEHGGGIAYSMAKQGSEFVFTTIRSFSEADGTMPNGGLVEGDDGFLYGTAAGGGPGGAGTVFRMSKDGNTYSVSHSFSYQTADGAEPRSALLKGSDGFLYGTTFTGGVAGTSGAGTVFKLKADNVGTGYEVIRRFSNLNDPGCFPRTELVEASPGILVGVGTSAVYRLGTDGGGYSYVRNFSSDLSGRPFAAVIVGQDQALYGTTAGSQISGGSVFRVNQNGTGYSVLRAFSLGTDDAAQPFSPLLQAADGVLFGMTYRGGISDNGAVFRIQPDGSGYAVLASLTDTGTEAIGPVTALVEDEQGALYGTTFGGGKGWGTVYRMNRNGSGYSVLHRFVNAPGQGLTPYGDLIIASDGLLYGTTIGGSGSVFRIGRDGSSYTVLHLFGGDPAQGASPYGGVIEGTDGVLYGSTMGGGHNHGGTLYKLHRDGTGFQVIHVFRPDQGDGGSPGGSFLKASDGYYYGTAYWGGQHERGTIYRFAEGGAAYETIYHFGGSEFAGSGPAGHLTQGPDGAIYGITAEGGEAGFGCVFRLAPNQSGTVFEATILRSFTGGQDGAWPVVGPTFASDGFLYGSCNGGGTYDPEHLGTLFRMKADGSQYEILKTFDGSNGEGLMPEASLTLGRDDAIYGSTRFGGAYNGGLIFRLRPPNRAPAANPQSVLAFANTPTPVILTGSDIDEDPLSYSVISSSANGTLAGTASALTYTPAPGFTGTDSFTFVANDGTLASAPATVQIKVLGVNLIGTAVQGIPAELQLGASPLSVTIVGNPSHGSVTVSGGTVVYTPSNSYYGPDSFTFTLSDGQYTSAVTTFQLNVRPRQGFHPLPGVSEPSRNLQMIAISGDGLRVGGGEQGTLGLRPAIWNQSGQLVFVGPNSRYGRVSAFSDNGQAAAGMLFQPDVPFRWSSSGGLQEIGLPPGASRLMLDPQVSRDGTAIVAAYIFNPGLSEYAEIWRWTQAQGFTRVGRPTTLPRYSYLLGSSLDGSVVVGLSDGINGSGSIWRWTEATGIVILESGSFSSPPEFSSLTSPFGSVSDDGNVVVWRGLGNDPQIRRWSGGVTTVLDGSPNFTAHACMGMTPDGNVIAGIGNGPAGLQLFRWSVSGGFEAIGHPMPNQSYGDLSIWLSSAGTHLVGSLQTHTPETGHQLLAFTWNYAVGYKLYDFTSRGTIVSAARDASIVCGSRVGNQQGWLWTEAGGFTDLAVTPQSAINQLTGLSANGTAAIGVAYGQSHSATTSSRGWIWTPSEGYRFLPDSGQDFQYTPDVISADGRTVAGIRLKVVEENVMPELWRWITGTGLKVEGILPVSPGYYEGAEIRMSADGNTISGTVYGETGNQTFHWNVSDGFALLAPLQWISSMSQDGKTVTGSQDFLAGAGVWKVGTGVEAIALPVGWSGSDCRVSADGKVLTGTAINSAAQQNGLWRLTATAGLEFLAIPATYANQSAYSLHAGFVANDARTIVGALSQHSAPSTSRVWIWTETGGLQILPAISGMSQHWFIGCSADGSVICGGAANSGGQGNPFVAWRWTASEGLRNVAQHFAPATEGWNLYPRAASSDGAILAGVAWPSADFAAQVWLAAYRPVIERLSPARATSGSGDLALSVHGVGFDPAAAKVRFGDAEVTPEASTSTSTELNVVIPGQLIHTDSDLATILVRVTGPGNLNSKDVAFTVTKPALNENTMPQLESAVAQPGESLFVSAPPASPTSPGISADLESSTGEQPVTVTAAVYSEDPAPPQSGFKTGEAYVDLKVSGATPEDRLVAKFYYPKATADEETLVLKYHDGAGWADVRSSSMPNDHVPSTDPLKNMTDDLDGTSSGGRFSVVFDDHSTPRLTELTGTVFALFDSRPEIRALSGPLAPVALGSSVTLTASYVTAGAPVVNVTFTLGDGSQTAAVPVGLTSASATHTYASPGVYIVVARATDASGQFGEALFQYVVVYDPNGGFVTGGGWIESPAGAYTPAPTLAGRANFGFVSKYEKGANKPTGNTEFQFKAGDLNFKSTSYEWLVVSGALAQYKGSGTINGMPGYNFLLTATDGQVAGGGGVDKFRIKITQASDSAVIYDNKIGATDEINAENTQAIGGGSIVIHQAPQGKK